VQQSAEQKAGLKVSTLAALKEEQRVAQME
jgi:hypothetical protein